MVWKVNRPRNATFGTSTQFKYRDLDRILGKTTLYVGRMHMGLNLMRWHRKRERERE